MQESMDKFGMKFVWSELPQFQQCVQNLGHDGANRKAQTKVSKDSIVWQELMKVHALDIELYDYALAFLEILKLLGCSCCTWLALVICVTDAIIVTR